MYSLPAKNQKIYHDLPSSTLIQYYISTHDPSGEMHQRIDASKDGAR